MKMPEYDQKNKQSLPKEVCEKYQDLSEEENNKKWRYGSKRKEAHERECYKNLSEDQKQRIVEYEKKKIYNA